MGPVGPQGLMGIPGIGSQGEHVIDAFSLSLSYRTFWPKPGVHWRPVRQTAMSTFDSGTAMVYPNGYVGRDKMVPQDSSFENLQRLKK